MITVDTASPTPPFEQIRSQFAAQFAVGDLVAGTRLPTVRRLAEDLGLAVNTVARAYRELEAAGVVETRGRAGTVVTAGGDRAAERLRDEAARDVALARDLGASAAEALAYVSAAVEASDRSAQASSTGR